MSAIIIYFSRAGENYVSGSIKKLTKGNTEIMAEIIQKITGAKLFKAEPIIQYSDDYNICIEEARSDQRRDARPELKNYPKNIDDYNTVYLGYPNYWSTMPMPLFTILDKYDFSGKTIIPFCTHEGSQMGKSEEDIKKLCPNATVKKGIAVYGSKVEESKSKIENWIKNN